MASSCTLYNTLAHREAFQECEWDYPVVLKFPQILVFAFFPDPNSPSSHYERSWGISKRENKTIGLLPYNPSRLQFSSCLWVGEIILLSSAIDWSIRKWKTYHRGWKSIASLHSIHNLVKKNFRSERNVKRRWKFNSFLCLIIYMKNFSILIG